MLKIPPSLVRLLTLLPLTVACEAVMKPALPDAGLADAAMPTDSDDSEAAGADDDADEPGRPRPTDDDDATDDDVLADDDVVGADDDTADDDDDATDDDVLADDDVVGADDDTADDDDATDDDDADDDDGLLEDCPREDLEVVVRPNGTVIVRCRSNGSPNGDGDTDDDVPTDDDTPDADDDTPATTGLCTPVDAIERLPARLSVVSSNATTSTPTGIFVDDVFDQFRSHCGACHVDFSLGNFQVTRNTFTRLVTRSVLESSMGATNTTKVMPPGDVLLSERSASDPVAQLYDLLLAWRGAVDPLVAANPNADPAVFFPPADDTADSTVSPYLLSPEQGEAMTNLGTCIPDPALVNTESTRSLELDAAFATMTQLPKSLTETDLFTLDSAELARHGVISYAPAYPLFSDDSGKMRHIRVPRGESLRFDTDTQLFEMPENTRFYKTFLKPVKQAGGLIGWRKIETRIIVARTDQLMPDGRREPTALYGSYIWNESETVATLTENPLRNGEPFRDVIFRYLVDEPNGQALLNQVPTPVDLDEQLRDRGFARHYAVPGSQRCVDCHRGSENHSFVLGFGPLQVNRLPKDSNPNDNVTETLHGLYDAPGVDDLTQLQRFIDYGLITGIGDVTEVLPLEDTQGVPPRNDYELLAQGYMVGNCGICHNPDGLASYENPVLRDVLDFWPDMDSGIFGFPLTGEGAFSPRILRTPGNTMPIPYVSPDLYDRPGMSKPTLAPWRSLIFRNVDTPFDYQDDGALFPHMPRNVGGFDQRLPRIMGDWMVSIPAREVPAANSVERDARPQTYEEVFEGDADYAQAVEAAEERLDAYHSGGRYDCREFDPQECPLNPDGTVVACVSCVDTRDIVDLEVIQATRSNAINLVPAARPDRVPVRPHWVNTDLTEPDLEEWPPRRPDWPAVLLCGNGRIDAPPGLPPEACDPGPSTSTTCTSTCKAINCGDATLTAEQLAECGRTPWHSESEMHALPGIREMEITAEFEELALGERPMTVWLPKPECDFDDDETVSSYSGTGPARWLDDFVVSGLALKKWNEAFPEFADEPPGGVPLYMQSPGEAVFAHICANCHGPQADSQGRQAATVALMSGGETRVANLRDGLFGAGNVEAQFGPYAHDLTGSAEDLAARYMAWMALGGTQRNIPEPVLALVRNVRVYGHVRPNLIQIGTPNMLELGVRLCSSLIGIVDSVIPPDFDLPRAAFASFGESTGDTPLLGWTGDFEAWRDLCTYDNPPPILVLQRKSEAWTGEFVVPVLSGYRLKQESVSGRKLYCADGYCEPQPEPEPVQPPANPLPLPVTYPYTGPLQYIGDHNGNSIPVLGGEVDPRNKQPWCVLYPEESATEATLAKAFAQQWQNARPGQSFPWCPAVLLEKQFDKFAYLTSAEENARWARRGAANAGMAVFLYLRAVTQGLQPKPAYDRCEERQ